MSSQSDGDRLLREHLALQRETDAIEAAHKELQAKPFDGAEHKAHSERLAMHQLRLREHAARVATANRAGRGLAERRRIRSA